MFDDLRETGLVKVKTHKRWTVIVSAGLQVALLGVLIVVPLIYPDTLLPKQMLVTLLVAPPPPPPPPPVAAPIQRVVRPLERIMPANTLVAPKAVPRTVAMVNEDPLTSDAGIVDTMGGVPGGVPGGQYGGVLGGLVNVSATIPLPPPKEGPKRVHLGGQLEEAKLVHYVAPFYPPLARHAAIVGTVLLHAVISGDGTVRELRAVSGDPLLIQAALDAVRQWRYQPTLLNGEPYEVDTMISVVFSLGGPRR